MKPGRTSGKARHRRVMASAREAVRKSWDGYDQTEPTIDESIRVARPDLARGEA